MKKLSKSHTGLRKHERTFLNRRARRSQRQETSVKETPTAVEIYRARESGLSWRLVGEMFGMSAGRAKRAYLEGVAKVVEESDSLEEARRKLNG